MTTKEFPNREVFAAFLDKLSNYVLGLYDKGIVIAAKIETDGEWNGDLIEPQFERLGGYTTLMYGRVAEDHIVPARRKYWLEQDRQKNQDEKLEAEKTKRGLMNKPGGSYDTPIPFE